MTKEEFYEILLREIAKEDVEDFKKDILKQQAIIVKNLITNLDIDLVKLCGEYWELNIQFSCMQMLTILSEGLYTGWYNCGGQDNG